MALHDHRLYFVTFSNRIGQHIMSKAKLAVMSANDRSPLLVSNINIS